MNKYESEVGVHVLDDLDKTIIAAMQDDLPIVEEPYLLLAESLRISEDELLERLRKYRDNGQMRKMGAVLRHREVGYAANALCAWNIPFEQHEEVARIMVASAAVTHCYGRITPADWPYNFYTMLHGQTREECRAIAVKLGEQTGIADYIMLFSTKEWKKTSMRYFSEEERHA